MTSDHVRIADSLPAQVRIAVTVLAINAKARLLEQRRPRAERRPPLVAVLISPHAAARAAAMAVVARHLNAPVQRVDWTRLLSPYLHETELNVERLFDAAEHAGVLLLFDEADALFGPHGRPIDLADAAHDACTEALLARMARYDGPVCFTASHRRHLHPRVLAVADPVIELTAAPPSA
jgi:hypothetical protein